MIKRVSKKLLSNKALLKYVSVSYLSIPISLVTGFLTFRKIDPVLMGFWSLFTVFETFTTVMRLGIVNGMNRELPNAMGAGKKDKVDRYASTTLFYTILEVLVLLVAAPIIIWQLAWRVDPNLKTYFYATALVSLIRVAVSFYITYLSGTLRSDDSFNKLSNINATILVMKLAFCPLVFLGFYGFLIYELVALLTNVFLLHKFRPIRVLPRFYKNEMFELFKIGFPIFLVSSAISYIDTIPRLYIIQYSTAEMLGLYTPVIMLISIISILPNSLGAYMYPKFTFQMAQSRDLNGIWKKLIRIYAASFVFILFSSLVGYYLLYYFVYLFPKYALSKEYLKLSLLLCPFVFFRMGNTLHIVLKKYNYMVLFTLIYGLAQLISLKVLSLYYIDIIEIVIWSQIYTSILVFIVGLGLNYRLLHLHRNSMDL